MEFYDFPYSVGNGKSSQQTFTPSFFRGVGAQPPTRIFYPFIINHYKPLFNHD
jgi:hypothetical protein